MRRKVALAIRVSLLIAASGILFVGFRIAFAADRIVVAKFLLLFSVLSIIAIPFELAASRPRTNNPS